MKEEIERLEDENKIIYEKFQTQAYELREELALSKEQIKKNESDQLDLSLVIYGFMGKVATNELDDIS